MSTKHHEQFADVGNGGELRFGELQPGVPVLTCGEYGQNVSVEELARGVWETVGALPGADLDVVMDVDEYERLVIEAGL